MYPAEATAQGILDMAGNVWEWCLNGPDNSEHPEALSEHPESLRIIRVLRGGSWASRPESLRASNRGRDSTDDRNGTIGFRLVQDIP
jgi:formylglycine-generating enzyme required for sulfatase activity